MVCLRIFSEISNNPSLAKSRNKVRSFKQSLTLKDKEDVMYLKNQFLIELFKTFLLRVMLGIGFIPSSFQSSCYTLHYILHILYLKIDYQSYSMQDEEGYFLKFSLLLHANSLKLRILFSK